MKCAVPGCPGCPYCRAEVVLVARAEEWSETWERVYRGLADLAITMALGAHMRRVYGAAADSEGMGV